MRRILIWRKVVPHDEVDIFSSTDYRRLFENLDAIYGGNCPNWGNKLWFQGLYSEISTDENDISFRTTDSVDEINNNYDLIIYPMANFFSKQYTDSMLELAQIFNKIKIPVYIIACGAQASSYDDLESLVEKIGTPASKFIESIYQTGGEFALRGYFTKEFFDRLGFSSAVVTGCPSLYQMGPEFKVSDKKVEIEQVMPIMNGRLDLFENIMKAVPSSIYMDQDYYAGCLYKAGYLQNFNLKDKILFSYNYSAYQAELLGADRIKMIADMNDWFHYIKDNPFNYAFGSRIHGNIMAILTGTPATVVAIDSRTQEMAEFFDIPYIRHQEGKKYSLEDFFHAYEDANYDKFNATYRSKYFHYENFLREHNIVTNINMGNRFFSKTGKTDFELYKPNQADFKDLALELKRMKPALWMGRKMIEFKNR